jgi:hypothetical protein
MSVCPGISGLMLGCLNFWLSWQLLTCEQPIGNFFWELKKVLVRLFAQVFQLFYIWKRIPNQSYQLLLLVLLFTYLEM